jgi:hypothetical protein
MKTVFRILKWTAIGLVLIIGGLFLFIQMSWDKTFEAPYPDITARLDSALIARGEYLAFGPSHCATCHVPMDKIRDVENGLKMPLIGGWEMELPGLGTFRAPNITPDPETGIGRYSDQEIARLLRHGVKPNGRTMLPFMPYQNMSDEDLTAIISFLRSQEPVKNVVPPSEFYTVGKALVAFGVLKPEGPTTAPPARVPIEPTAAYGKYVVHTLANCRGCHTEMDLNTGQYIGTDLAGKNMFPPDHFSGGYAYMAPNLTPCPETGIIAHWSEDQFISRFRAGRVYEGSHMPWGAFSRLDTVELRAVYAYLQSLDPVHNPIEKIVYLPGEALPIE